MEAGFNGERVITERQLWPRATPPPSLPSRGRRPLCKKKQVPSPAVPGPPALSATSRDRRSLGERGPVLRSLGEGGPVLRSLGEGGCKKISPPPVFCKWKLNLSPKPQVCPSRNVESLVQDEASLMGRYPSAWTAGPCP
jgi:hypothetical protein